MFIKLYVNKYTMKLTKTVTLKLRIQNKDLDKSVKKYTKGMNYVSRIVYKSRKPISVNKLQKLTYKHLRDKIGLKSQMSCNIIRQVCGTYKSLMAMVVRKESEWQLIKYKPNNITYSFRRDFTINKNELSITTINGRKKYPIANYKHAEQYFDETWKYLASKLIRHRSGMYYFHLSMEKEIPQPDITKTTDLIGVDLGMNYLAVVTTTNKQNVFFCGGEIKNTRNLYSKQRKRLQSKGTRSAKRMLRHLARREKRLMTYTNHVVSKRVVGFAKTHRIPMIAMEKLKDIRNTTKVRKKQRYQHNSWAFRQLQRFIEYKATEQGIRIVYVDPRHTSQTCSRCGHVEKANRNGRKFLCRACGYELNADLNGARNIEHRARDFRQNLESQGCVVDHPYGNSLQQGEFQAQA